MHPTKPEVLSLLSEMIKNLEDLPQQAMSLPITHYDYYSLLMVLHSFFLADLASSCSSEIAESKAS